MASDSSSDRDFGNALVDLKILLIDRVLEGKRAQRKAGANAKPLDQTLVELGYLTDVQVRQVYEHLGKGAVAQKAAEPEPIDPKSVEVPRPEITNLPGYEIVRRIGSGSMGKVFLARQVSMGRDVAIKILPPRLAADASYVARFQREARTAAKLNHPNVITVYDVAEHQGVHYFVMEYIDGPTGQNVLDGRGRLDEKMVIDIGIQVAKALEAAHRAGIVHRDVKPQNIMITRDQIVKLCDLGLAREASAVEGTSQITAGTPYYMAPEQARGETNLDVRTDLYSLGATLYHMLTGQVPFNGETNAQIMAKHVAESLVPPKQRRPEIGERLNGIIVRLMLKDRADRFQSPTELIAALQPLADEYRRVAGQPVAPPAPAPAAPAAPAYTPSPPTPVTSPVRVVSRRAYAPQRSNAPFVVGGLLAIAFAIFLLRDRFATLFAKPVPIDDGGHTRKNGDRPADPAKAGLDDLLASVDRDTGFEAVADLLKRFDEYREKHRGTVWEGKALEERKKYVEKLDTFAKTELEAIRSREGTLRSGEKWRDLMKLYGTFPRGFLDTTATGREVKEEMARIGARATEKLTTDRSVVTRHVKEGRLGDAIALLRMMEEYALESAVPELVRQREELEKERSKATSAAAQEVADKYMASEMRWREDMGRRDYQLAIASMARFLDAFRTDPKAEEQRRHILLPDVDYAALKAALDDAEAQVKKGDVAQALVLWETALATCETYAGDPASPVEVDTAHRMLLDLRNAIALELLRQQAQAGVDRLVVTREALSLETYHGARGHFEVRDARVTFVAESGPAIKVEPLADFVEPDLVALAARSLDADAVLASKQAQESPKFLVRSGLLYMYAKSDKYIDRAYAALTKAVEQGARGVRVYLANLRDAARGTEEKRLVARWEQAQAHFRNREWARAKEICEELLRSNEPWVAQRRAEISRMHQQCIESSEGEDTLGATYRGAVERLPDGRLKVRYDFEKPVQAEAFEVLALPSKGRWLFERGVMESSKLASAVRWRHRTKGDVEVEYAVTALENPQNVVTTLYWNDKSDRHYSASLEFDLATGRDDPRNELEAKYLQTRTCVIKYPIEFDKSKANLPGEWEKVKGRFVGRGSDVRFRSGGTMRVRLSRTGKSLRWFLDEKPVWEGEDADYTDGYVLFYSDSRVRIDNLVITFKP